MLGELPYIRVIPKVENLHQNMILHQRHPTIYTNRNLMGAPRIDKGKEGTPQLYKIFLYSIKSSPILLTPNNPYKG